MTRPTCGRRYGRQICRIDESRIDESRDRRGSPRNQARRTQSLWHGFADMGAVQRDGEFVVERGDGAYIWDSAGNRYVDATAGLWFTNVGHGRTEIADAVAHRSAGSPRIRHSATTPSTPQSRWPNGSRRSPRYRAARSSSPPADPIRSIPQSNWPAGTGGKSASPPRRSSSVAKRPITECMSRGPRWPVSPATTTATAN